jgi:hypothetical protein
MAQQLISKIWQISGLVGNAVPGILLWKNQEVAFITEKGIIFNLPISEIKEVKWPFLRMGLGFDAVINGEKFKFTFAKPNPSAPDIEYKTDIPFPKVFFAAQNFDDLSLRNLKADRAAAKAWKKILQGNGI